MSDTCGAPTEPGTPCELPSCRPDGRCWHHTEHDDLRANGGRESKLTLERQEEIAQAIENGKSMTSASRMAGITPRTFINWMDLGREEVEGPYSDFFQRITRAKGHGENFWVNLLEEAARDDPATIMAILKTQYKESWGDVKRGEQADGATEFTFRREVVDDPEPE